MTLFFNFYNILILSIDDEMKKNFTLHYESQMA